MILQNSSGSKKKWFGKKKLNTSDSYPETDQAPPFHPPEAEEEIILTHVENQNNHDHVEVVPDVDVDVPVPDVQIETVEVQAAPIVQVASKPNDEVAAIMIQTTFRRYLVFILCLTIMCLNVFTASEKTSIDISLLV